jgi:hypothetical protein
MYHVILKHDIIQAAFSVCYYIKNAQEAAAASSNNNDSSNDNNNSSNNYNSNNSNADANASTGLHNGTSTNTLAFDASGRPLWSAKGMTRVVEKTLEDLIMLIRDSTSDLKDIVALSIVIKSVQPGGSREQRTERIRGGISRILDACLQSLKTTPEGLGALTGLTAASSSASAAQNMLTAAGGKPTPTPAAQPGPDQPQLYMYPNSGLPVGANQISTTGVSCGYE